MVVPTPIVEVVAETVWKGCVQASYEVRPVVLPPTHVILIAKQPFVILKPTLDVEDARAEMFRPIRVVVPYPDPEMERAETDVVAKPATVVVER